MRQWRQRLVDVDTGAPDGELELEGGGLEVCRRWWLFSCLIVAVRVFVRVFSISIYLLLGFNARHNLSGLQEPTSTSRAKVNPVMMLRSTNNLCSARLSSGLLLSKGNSDTDGARHIPEAPGDGDLPRSGLPTGDFCSSRAI